MAEYSVIGKSIPRVDAVDKVTGKIRYTTDFKENFLSAKVLRSPHPHAKILSIDVSKAKAYPGVRGVVTPDDAPKKRTGYVLCPDRYVLPIDGIVRYVGEPIAVVAADTEDIAEEALELIEVKYETLPAIFDAEKAIEPDCNIVIHPDKLSYAPPGLHLMGTVMEREIPNGCSRFRIRKGDVDKAFKEADLIVENRYSFDGGSHARAEPFNVEAWVEDGVMNVRCNRMRMWACQGWLANLFGVAPNKVRMMLPAVGGAFGGKGTIVTESLALMASIKTGRRVRLSYTREEEFIDTNPRPSLIVYIKDGVKKDGTLVARKFRIIADVGAYGAAGGTITCSTCHFGVTSVYNVQNFWSDATSVFTNNPSTGTHRGVEAPQVTWAAEQNMDIIAERLGIDPVELRRKNIIKIGDSNAFSQIVKNAWPGECLDKAAELIEWNKKPILDGKWKKAKGLAICSYGAGPWWPSASSVKVFRDGSIEARVGTDEVGQGLVTTFCMIVAEQFGTTVDKVTVLHGDTQICPWDWGSVASRSTWMTGNSLIMACKEAKDKMRKLAAIKLDAPADDLEISGGKIYPKSNPKKSITIGELFLYDFAHESGEIIGHGWNEQPHTVPDPETGYSPAEFPSYSHLCYGVEVAVNIETGVVKLLRVVAAMDIGQAINWKMAESQIDGSIGTGTGNAIFEKFERNKGMILNPSWVTYRQPSANEVPGKSQITYYNVGKPDPNGPFGAKALGEMGLIPFHAAIGNAVYNATGVRYYDAPVTRERVFIGLQAAKKTT